MEIIVVYRKNDSENAKRLYGKKAEMSVITGRTQERAGEPF
jgi:hypothetical protein